MQFMIHTNAINDWLAKQKSEIEFDPIPNDIEIEIKSKNLSKKVDKTLYISGAILSLLTLITTPILIIYILGVLELWGHLSQTIRFFVYFIILGLMGVEFKYFLIYLKMACNKDKAENKATLTRLEYLNGVRKYYANLGDIAKVTRCHLEYLMLPLEVAVGGEIDASEYLEKQRKNIDSSYLSLFDDLLFVRSWYWYKLYPIREQRGIYYKCMPMHLIDSERLIEFATIMNKMAEDQKDEFGGPHKVMVELKNLFALKGALKAAAAVLPS